MGVATGTFGGMIRDLLCGRIPLVLKQEIYATASVLGGIIYWVLTTHLQQPVLATIFGVSAVTSLRILAIEYGWRLPKLN